MTNRLPFQHWHKDGLAWSLFASEEERPVHVHWSGLFENDTYERPPESQPFFRFAINNINTEEVAVYCGMAWTLLQSKEVFGHPVHIHAEDFESWDEAELITWSFRVNTADLPGQATIKGWERAHSSVYINPPPTPKRLAL